jgi:PRTRC genetic system protein D
MYCLGIDIGRSGTKIVISNTATEERKELPIIPSLARTVLGASFDFGGGQKSASVWTVKLADREWTTGHDAVVGRVAEPANYAEWHRSEEYQALMTGIFQFLGREKNIHASAICAGLPSEASSEDRAKVQSLIEGVAHGAKVKVVPQPAGAFMAAAEQHPELFQGYERTLIIDVGRYSTDCLMTIGGKPDIGSLHSTEGVRRAVADLETILKGTHGMQGASYHFDRLEEALRTNQLKMSLREHRDVSKEVAAAKTAFRDTIFKIIDQMETENKNAIDSLIIAGGGSDIVDLSEYKAAIRPQGGRYAIAHGFARIARKMV